MPSLPFTIVDVFTDVALAGNQLGVFTEAAELSATRMQQLALELGFSECTFVLPAESGGDARIRIFTPAEELPFAGHPVLGTAVVLSEASRAGDVVLETGMGSVPVSVTRAQGHPPFGRMSQPIPRVSPFGDTELLLAALGVPASILPVELYDNGAHHVFICLPSEGDVAALRPDFAKLAEVTGACVNCFAASGTSVKTRMFVPGLGVDEDPATGSAAGPLAVHLARHGRIAWGDEVRISQGAEIGRPSTLFALAQGDGDIVERVEVAGSAVIVARGTFEL